MLAASPGFAREVRMLAAAGLVPFAARGGAKASGAGLQSGFGLAQHVEADASKLRNL